MKYISLPDEKVRPLSFYLAMEEFVARRLDEPESLFLWQVEPSVIFGRNQSRSIAARVGEAVSMRIWTI